MVCKGSSKPVVNFHKAKVNTSALPTSYNKERFKWRGNVEGEGGGGGINLHALSTVAFFFQGASSLLPQLVVVLNIHYHTKSKL